MGRMGKTNAHSAHYYYYWTLLIIWQKHTATLPDQDTPVALMMLKIIVVIPGKEYASQVLSFKHIIQTLKQH